MPRCASVKLLSGFGALKSALKVLSSRIWVCPQDLVLSRMLSQCSQAGFGCALRNRCSQSVFRVLSKVGIGALKVLSGHRVLSRHGIGALKVLSNSALRNRCSQDGIGALKIVLSNSALRIWVFLVGFGSPCKGGFRYFSKTQVLFENTGSNRQCSQELKSALKTSNSALKFTSYRAVLSEKKTCSQK